MSHLQMGYGSRAIQALNSFYSGEYFNLDEAVNLVPSYPEASAIDSVRASFLRGELQCEHPFNLPVH